ncbi:hypothetical protein Hanom_Chr05g00443921 [Helianthus anomalus]
MKLFDSNNSAGSGLSRSERLFIYPAFENRTEPAFSQHAIGPEITGGHFQIRKVKTFQIG